MWQRCRPDEKGIETSEGVFAKRSAGKGSAAAPMRRGLKPVKATLFRAAGVIGQRCRPDEKGIETVMHEYLRSGFVPAALPPR